MLSIRTDEVKGSVTVKSCSTTSVHLTLWNILRVLQRTSNEVFLGTALKMDLITNEDEEVKYRFRNYNSDMTLRSSISMSHAEWEELVCCACDISPPPVNDEICCLCSEYVASEIHYGCYRNLMKMAVFMEVDFGKDVIAALLKGTLDRYSELVGVNAVYDMPIDYTNLNIAYGYVKKAHVLDIMGVDTVSLIQKGPSAFNNENILKYDQHFRNLKVCAKDYILTKIEEQLGGDLQQSFDSGYDTL